ncbi:helix-turn-helix domain-containing protein [Proteiniphilum saccharofermentans]|uniref:helix-turn-helix domain-containing protein n=1 Tax=Proteiniphilum saccharofermentans TaxID=1642647 RepID=UPI0028B03A0A|nr:helix-turn-helix domain-containing protein [Proteiniphilum saccharofermentans]
MDVNQISFDKLPEAVAHLIKEVTQIKEMVECNQNQNSIPTKRVPIGLEEACRIIGKAKPTVYALVRKRLLPSYKNGKKLYFFEDELVEWISNSKRKTIQEIEAEAWKRIIKPDSKVDENESV